MHNFYEEQFEVVKRLENVVKNGKYSHAYLFETNGYSNAFDFVLSFAKELILTGLDENEKEFVSKYEDFKNFPEIEIIYPEEANIKKEQLIELQRNILDKSLFGNKKVYIINYVELLNESSGNSLLKLLEDPAPNTYALLITKDRFDVIETIVSRCQLILLKANKNNSNDYCLKVAKQLFNNQQQQKIFIEKNKENNFVDNVLNFIIKQEELKKDVLVFSNKYFFNYFINRKDIILAIKIVILYYKDAVRIKSGKSSEIFQIHIDSIVLQNSLDVLLDKLYIYIQSEKKIKANMNINLFLDQLILDLER